MTPAPTGRHGDLTYAIRVQGRLDARWSAWFDGLDVTSTADGTTTIQGAVADQAALHGLLQKVRDVGLPILSVARSTHDDQGTHPPTPTTTEGH